VIPFIKKLWHDFFYDPAVGSRIGRGLLLWLGGMAVSILAFPYDEVATWTFKEWLYRIVAAGVLGFAGIMKVGEKNMTPEQMRTALKALPPETT